ncbi:MAG: ABC transporter ATP-binding protein [Firmicutes bacterium]|nr:ABC transporter ATP-binding protein [Bacillota bacterium]MBQ3199444.1 ABC transporter ATP-binding protein [Bacillota bacterium]
MDYYFKTENLAVGYGGNILIHDINVKLEKGKILTLIGPNGAGKSTILKSITRQLETIRGTVYINAQEVALWSPKDMAKQVAVVLTDRIRPELMTCVEVVAMGRYPYTNLFGKLTDKDIEAVHEALERVHALDLAEQDFATLSDGQRQRIMLARAICQEPEIIVLDEPTAYLDIRHKIELLDILREMSQKKHITVIMSLHEIDLAMKISDYLLCVKGDTIEAFGPPDVILKSHTIEHLYGLDNGSYNLLFGSVELAKPQGPPKVFVVAGGGYGIPCYRALQKQEVPFATGILFENDVDCQVAKELSDHVIVAPAFETITEAQFREASEILLKCDVVIDAGTPVGTFNQLNSRLLQLAEAKKIPVHHNKNKQEVQVWKP